MSEFAVVIITNENQNSKTIILDTVNDVSIDGQSTVTTQPMVNGDEIADHMFRHGKTMSLSGTISMNGSKGIIIDGNGTTLVNFQEEFERIQKNGIDCTIYKVALSNEKDIRFLQRQNMVLTNIGWIEKINSLDFSMSFQQILLSNVVQIDVDTDDAYLPNITEPETLSFTSVFLGEGSSLRTTIISTVEKILDKESLWSIEFKTFIHSVSKPAFVSGILALSAIAAGGAASAAFAAGSALAAGILTAGIGLAVGAVAIFGIGLYKSIKKAKEKKKYLIEPFKYYKNNDKKNEQEKKRYEKFITGIVDEFESLNKKLTVYQVSENIPQETMISVGDDYFIFTFTKNNVSQNWSLKVENVDQSITKDYPNVEEAPTDFSQLTSSDALVTANNNNLLYIVCPSEEKSDLTKYFIIVSSIKPEEFNNLITKVINNHIYR